MMTQLDIADKAMEIVKIGSEPIKEEHIPLLVSLLNESKIHQKDFEWQFNVPKVIFDALKFDTPIALDLESCEHRWCITAIDVFRPLPGVFVGVRVLKSSKSESASWSDHYHHLEFYLMEPIPTITYKIINNGKG